MEHDREESINKIKLNREKYKNAKTLNEKQAAADAFKEGLKGLAATLKVETNESLRQSLMAKLPDLENELIKMLGDIKKQSAQRPQQQTPVTQNHNPPKVNPANSEQQNKLQNQLSDAIVKEKPNVRWDDVAGLEPAKKALKEAVILPIKFPEIFVGQRIPWKGILLYGVILNHINHQIPPGTGKTFLAKACATQMEKGTFFSVSSSDLMSKYVGESEKTIKTLFQMARNEKPSIIFIDEIDSIAGNRSDNDNEASRRVKTEFLVQMQGVGNDTTGVLVLGATNLPWALDPAVRRRFERRVYIPLPEFRARLGLLSKLISGNPNDISEDELDQLAQKTEGFSGSDISVLVRDAMFQPLRFCQAARKFVKCMEDGKEKWAPCNQNQNRPGFEYRSCSMHDLPSGSLRLPPLQYSHFQLALQKSKPSVNQADLEKYVQFTKTFGQDGA